jgi:hypothetical protein
MRLKVQTPVSPKKKKSVAVGAEVNAVEYCK